MSRRPKPSVPDYASSSKESIGRNREASKEGCEICGTKKNLYVFVKQGSSKLRCSCRKHLRRIK